MDLEHRQRRLVNARDLVRGLLASPVGDAEMAELRHRELRIGRKLGDV
jgi:hypothetical protein